MKFYIFLDVDGVLNKEADWKIPFSLDRNCVKALSDFVSKTGQECRIVLVSTWRAGAAGNKSNSRQYDRLCKVLAEYGLTIFDTTPLSNKGRQAEVEFYIRRNQVDDHIVIDDDRSLYEEPDRLCFYEPDYKTGFTRGDVGKALKQLKQFRKSLMK